VKSSMVEEKEEEVKRAEREEGTHVRGWAGGGESAGEVGRGEEDEALREREIERERER